ncbi:glycosyltransferase family 2 protein [Gelidibacter salicanalis]|uniref:Glycosyltransferase family 2 protein n=1 Tax=Gelidibacter salicanalis TaxID=291193 RepID=A0A934KN75_9FLAO|nr:glycosyltransferase family 2 protein [Gelidibacter salicanalis]MBJ7882337.1 glycosyltransferase family 2 protein [Gelidibacter salicanalis]
MKLSVVIVNYNVRYFLELCLKSVQAAITTLDAEILVVDNHSSDDSCQMVKQLFPEITLIQNEQNLGFSKANNRGVAHAKGEYVCMLNPDTVVAEDTFIKCLAYADSVSKLGILGCQLIDGRGQFLPESKRNIPTPKVSFKKILGFPKSYYATHLAPSDIGKVEVLVGAFMLLKKSVFHQVNGFDEDYFMYGEDIDLSYKVLKAGYQNVYYGEMTILHYKGESTLKNKVYISRFYGAMQIFYTKHFKSNPAFNTMVWMGVKWSRFLFKSPKQIEPHTSNYVVVSDQLNFNKKLPFQFQVVANSKSVSTHTQFIFDGNVIKYKDIIADMATLDKKKSFTFRILPSNAQFIIGSDSSEQRGEVLLFP